MEKDPLSRGDIGNPASTRADAPAAGAVSPSGLAAAVTAHLVQTGDLDEETLAARTSDIGNFAGYLERGQGIFDVTDITQEHITGFVHSRRSGGKAPAVSRTRARHFALAMLFSTGQGLGLIVTNPMIGLEPPVRADSLRTRPLTDLEIEICRGCAVPLLQGLRRPIAFALSEATAQTDEIHRVLIEDVEPEAGRVWLKGTPRVDPRWAHFTDWGLTQIERRFRGDETPDPADQLMVWRTNPKSGRAASSQALRETFKAAGLGDDPAVHPRSVIAWAGATMYKQGVPIDEVARRLGYRSVDQAAVFIGVDLRTGGPR